MTEILGEGVKDVGKEACITCTSMHDTAILHAVKAIKEEHSIVASSQLL